MSFYTCIYFDSDKSLSMVPKRRYALRGPFEAGQEAEVNWGGQRFIGVILKTANKGMCFKLYFMLDYLFIIVLNAALFGGQQTGHDCLKMQKYTCKHVYV